MKKYLHKRTVEELTDYICGGSGGDNANRRFPYRSGTALDNFFDYCDLPFQRGDHGTRFSWVLDALEEFERPPGPRLPNYKIVRILRELMDQANFPPDDEWNRSSCQDNALAQLNETLARDALEAYWDERRQLQLRTLGTDSESTSYVATGRAWSEAEYSLRAHWAKYLDNCSEDNFIEKLLMPLFRQMGFQRIKAAGHADKALEYGKDLWMKYRLPTNHFLYFGLQAKKGKLDAAASGKNENVATVLRQIDMMLMHPIFDEEINGRVLVDHVMIAAAGGITKPAQNFLIGALDASQRRTIIFMHRDELLDLAVDHRVTFPGETSDGGRIPF